VLARQVFQDSPAGTVYTYDKAGNRLTAGADTFTYDDRNRLLSDPDGTYSWNPNGTLDTFTPTVGAAEVYGFDAANRLTGISDGTDSTSYSCDVWDRVVSRSDDGAVTNGFTYTAAGIEPSGDGDDVFACTAAGTLLATATSGGTSDTVFPVFSTRNDLLALIGADGVEVGSKHFEPFGGVEATSGRATALGFQTDWTDPDTEHVWIWVR